MSNFSQNWTQSQSVNQQLWLETAYTRLKANPFWYCAPLSGVVISYGFPNGRGRAGSTGGAAYRRALDDGRHVIMIHPKQWTTPQTVMARLAHEMLHTQSPSTRNRHDGTFEAYARGYFKEPYAEAIPNEVLEGIINNHLPTLPPFPVSTFNPAKLKTASTRNELYECNCEPAWNIKGPTKVRHAGRTLEAICLRCLERTDPSRALYIRHNCQNAMFTRPNNP